MASVRSDEGSGRNDTSGGSDGALALKILVVGGPGAGKSSLVETVSSLRTLRPEGAPPHGPAVPSDGAPRGEKEQVGTVALEFGRITIRAGLSLYLFAAPGDVAGQAWWGALARDALGVIVLADTRELSGCFPAVDLLERDGLPFVVAVNCFRGARDFGSQEVLRALDLKRGAPVMLCDARDRDSVKDVVIRLVEHASRQFAGETFREAEETRAPAV